MRVFRPKKTPVYTPHKAASYLAAILDASDDAIIGKNLSGVITSWNRAVERTFGYTAEEEIGQSIALIGPPDRLREEDLFLSRLRSGLGVEHHETVRRRKDGQLFDIVLTVSPIKDPDGGVTARRFGSRYQGSANRPPRPA